MPWILELPLLFRGALAMGGSLLLGLLLGRRLIAWLNARFCDPIVSPSAELEKLHQGKRATPTMGGLFLVAGIVAGTLAFGDLTSGYVQVALLLTLGLALLGAVDDLAKLRSRRRGISARAKLGGQVVLASIAALLLYRLQQSAPGGLDLQVPLTDVRLALGWLFVPLAVLVIVGASNAVNLTDGLDGLAGGCLLFATAGMAVMVYLAGDAELANSLGLLHVPGASEGVIVAAGMLGGLLGFLWFNCHPAQVFMGDTGSLPLGGLLGLLAVMARQELLLVVIGGVFVVEAVSVILQVGSFRLRGVRIFRCAPLHHHFQFTGWPESQIVVRFWIASALCALLGVASIKLPLQQPAPLHNLSPVVGARGERGKAEGGGRRAERLGPAEF